MIGVVAMNAAGCIGRAGTLPWHHREDLQFFKQTTTGGTVVMGRKTWDGLPRKPLPERDNVVLTRDPSSFEDPGAIATTLDDLVRTLEPLRSPCFVIGGGEVYELLWSRLNEILITRVPDEVPDGDTFFPARLTTDFELVDSQPLTETLTIERWTRRDG